MIPPSAGRQRACGQRVAAGRISRSRVTSTHAAMLTILDRGPGRVLGIRLKGKLTEEALEQATDLMEARIREHGKIRVLFHLVDLGGVEPRALVEDLKFAIKHIRDFERYAAVGDQAWLGPWVKAAGFLVAGEGRTFASGDLEEAWGWLEEGL